jgi:hypothetical protein
MVTASVSWLRMVTRRVTPPLTDESLVHAARRIAKTAGTTTASHRPRYGATPAPTTTKPEIVGRYGLSRSPACREKASS